MITIHQLAEGFALNQRLITMQSAGLSHADSLIQTPYNINCLNWVLGHLAVNRDRVLSTIGEESLLSEGEFDRYKTESDPIKEDGEDVIKLERLLEILTEGQDKINQGFSKLTETQLSSLIQVGERQIQLGERLHGFYFHDTYHTGQTDMLRQIAGTNDKII
jgi:uncharacterized damage-inducible protein DinB